jgi:hypothetical protein
MVSEWTQDSDASTICLFAIVPLVWFAFWFVYTSCRYPHWLNDYQAVPMVPHRWTIPLAFLLIYVLMTVAWWIQPKSNPMQLWLFLAVPLIHSLWIAAVVRKSWLVATYSLQVSQLVLLYLVFLSTHTSTRIAFLPINTLVAWIAGYSAFVVNKRHKCK